MCTANRLFFFFFCICKRKGDQNLILILEQLQSNQNDVKDVLRLEFEQREERENDRGGKETEGKQNVFFFFLLFRCILISSERLDIHEI